jgi:hypothetical protein
MKKTGREIMTFFDSYRRKGIYPVQKAKPDKGSSRPPRLLSSEMYDQVLQNKRQNSGVSLKRKSEVCLCGISNTPLD